MGSNDTLQSIGHRLSVFERTFQEMEFCPWYTLPHPQGQHAAVVMGSLGRAFCLLLWLKPCFQAQPDQNGQPCSSLSSLHSLILSGLLGVQGPCLSCLHLNLGFPQAWSHQESSKGHCGLAGTVPRYSESQSQIHKQLPTVTHSLDHY